MEIKKASVIGLGKLGLPIATCIATNKIPTIGVDKSTALLDSLKKWKVPFYEPGLQKKLNESKNYISFTSDFKEAVVGSDVTFLIVPTPSDKHGEFSSTYLEDAFIHLSAGLREKDTYHLFVVNSTVMPGTSDKNLIPLIEKASGKKINKDFGFCYNPEFIALGSVIRNLLNPDVLLIGESSAEDGKKLERFYSKILENRPKVARMSIISAEIMKISLNVYVTMKISFANQLSQICRLVPGADIDAITEALGGDKRIGSHYFKAGMGYGGPCFPRDNRAFSVFAKKLGRKALLSEVTDQINKDQTQLVLETMTSYLNGKSKVLVLGVSYKEDTGFIEESTAVRLIEKLLAKNIKVSTYDTLAARSVEHYFAGAVKNAPSLTDTIIDDHTICVIALPSPEYVRAIESHRFTKKTVIIDCWRAVDPTKLKGTVTYVPLGKFLKTDQVRTK